jgi:hypothetical protein
VECERRCLFGSETEYALAAVQADGGGASHSDVHRGFMASARAMLPHLPDLTAPGDGMFLTNGGRLYYDSGLRIEYATPEVTDPADLVRYVRAGDSIVADVVRHLKAARPDWREVFCSRTGVDSMHRTAWGTHESVLLRWCSPQAIGEALTPFLVSRIVYAGCGGFDVRRRGLRFLVSPRAAFITCAVSADTTRQRPIHSSRDEPLARQPYRRLHIACGEPLCSDVGLYLRAGATALVVRVLDRDRGVAAGLTLEDPVAALHAIAEDPACRRRVRMANGRRLSALEIQRTYLELVEVQLATGWLPDWAEEVCRCWRSALDGLSEDPMSQSHTLDWAIKRAVYQRFLEQQGIDQQEWQRINRALNPAALRRVAPPRRPPPAGAGDEPSHGWIRAIAEIVAPWRSAGVPAERRSAAAERSALERARACRARLFELDLRWGELGPRGVFESLDAQGCLQHRVEGCDGLERAKALPPPTGRAHVRGEVVRRFSTEKRPGICGWDAIRDVNGVVLDLSDPFGEREHWSPVGPGLAVSGSS